MTETKRPKARITAVEAEAATIAAIVCNHTILGWLPLSEEHFSLPIHKAIFVAMRGLYENDKPIDEVTVLNACLAENSRIEISAVTKIVVSASTADNAEFWVEILEEARRMRVLNDALATASKIITGQTVGDSGAVQDILLAQMEALSLVRSERVSDLGEATAQELARMESQWEGGSSPRYPFGIADLDYKSGGIPVGVISALGARTGTGKSTVLWNIFNSAATRGDHVLVMSNEDRPDVMARLGMAHSAGIERKDLLAGRVHEDDKDAIRAQVEAKNEINSRIHTLRIHGRDMRAICREATGLIRRYNIKIAALDYIQNVPNPEAGMNRNYGIEENLTTLEAMIASENIPMIVIGQLKRLEDGRVPTIQDLKDSGSIEQKAKLILLLSEGEGGVVEVDIAKNSEGPKNMVAHLHIDFGLGRIA